MDQYSQPPEMARLLGDLEIPGSYPSSLHIQIHNIAHECFEAMTISSDIQSEFRAALNSLVYRFKSCVESGESFSQSVIHHGAAPPQPQRYYQERDFFFFVISGVTCLESLNYALFAWGAAIYPQTFPFQTDAQRRRVTLDLTASAYQNIPEGIPVANVIKQIKDSQDYNRWTTLRRVLFHRGLPGRLIIASTGPEHPRGRYHPFADIEGIEIHPDVVSSMIGALVYTIDDTLRLALAMLQSQRGLWG